MIMHERILLSFWASALMSLGAQAAIFCVDNPATFQATLNVAQLNGEASNTIKVVGGDYLLTTGLTYTDFPNAVTRNLTLIGGFPAGCAAFPNTVTTLNGQNAVRPLAIITQNANVRITGFEFVAGRSPPPPENWGGGLKVNNSNGTVSIELNRFFSNHSDDTGGGLSVLGGALRIMNNLFYANTAHVSGAADLFGSSSEENYINSNTVAGNRADTATGVGGMRIGALGSGDHYSVANNIFWGNNSNGAADVSFLNGHVTFYNDYGTVSGVPADASSFGNISLDPQFQLCGLVVCFSHALKRTSPMIDAGFNTPLGGLTGVDIFGHPRIDNGIVDIGAAEFTGLFANGFE
jgi:hypothetical protein